VKYTYITAPIIPFDKRKKAPATHLHQSGACAAGAADQERQKGPQKSDQRRQEIKPQRLREEDEIR
jgi:hypothetical protein